MNDKKDEKKDYKGIIIASIIIFMTIVCFGIYETVVSKANNIMNEFEKNVKENNEEKIEEVLADEYTLGELKISLPYYFSVNEKTEDSYIFTGYIDEKKYSIMLLTDKLNDVSVSNDTKQTIYMHKVINYSPTMGLKEESILIDNLKWKTYRFIEEDKNGLPLNYMAYSFLNPNTNCISIIMIVSSYDIGSDITSIIEKNSKIDYINSIPESSVNAETETGEDIILSAGKYVVGEDIKSGKYDVIAQSGHGNLYAGASGDRVIESMSDKENSQYITEYHNLRLKEGDEVEITSTLKVLLKAK